MLKACHTKDRIEAGLDEAGRGCLAGPVFAACVILPKKYKHKHLNDSKQLSRTMREELRKDVERDAIQWAVGVVSHEEIDEINILNASFLAMHRALDQLQTPPELLLIDGNRFKSYKKIPHLCVVEGDGKYYSIAAASILAKTYRDDFMSDLAMKYPLYDWENNMGYATPKHRLAIKEHGVTPFHRLTFTFDGNPNQLGLF